jgi:hypothetical protein
MQMSVWDLKESKNFVSARSFNYSNNITGLSYLTGSKGQQPLQSPAGYPAVKESGFL